MDSPASATTAEAAASKSMDAAEGVAVAEAVTATGTATAATDGGSSTVPEKTNRKADVLQDISNVSCRLRNSGPQLAAVLLPRFLSTARTI